jgi:glycosyltransferase involved in cell wall biosynthesis
MGLMVSLVYLGRRGGGALLTENCYRVGSSLGLVNRILISSKNELNFINVNKVKVTKIPVTHGLKSLFFLPFNLIFQFLASVSWAFKTRGDLIVFLMPSPFDLLTLSLVRLFNNKVVLICHDASAHHGESWPTPRAINRRVKLSNLVVALSSSEASKLRQLVPLAKIDLLEHPVFEISGEIEPLEIVGQNFDEPIFLLVGRLRGYKGIERLIESWKSQKTGTLLIAGEGDLDSPPQKNCVLINRWLTESEILYLIKSSDVVLFPYTSASQSGLIPLVRKLNKPVISSKMNGLMEQLNGYEENTIWIDDLTVEALTRSLERFLQLKTRVKKEGNLSATPISILAFLNKILETWHTSQTRGNRDA